MKDKSDAKINLLFLAKKYLVVIIAILISIIALVGLYFLLQPQRTVASFCKTATEQKSILIGNVNYEKRLEAYKKLETASPDDIRPDITAIRKGYEEIVKNPSNTLGAGFGMVSAENRRDAFIKTNCKDF